MLLFRLRCIDFAFLVILVCYSCGQKSYEELLQENKELELKIQKRHEDLEEYYKERQMALKAEILDSLEKGYYGENRDSVLTLWSGKKLYNAKRFAKVNEVYSNKDALYIVEEVDFDTLYYTIPATSLEKRYRDTVISTDKNFSFTPDTTGFYYWSGVYKVLNSRTNQVREYKIVDSIYVRK